MAEKSSSSSGGGGCGCLSLILFILVAWALFFGLSTSWGTFHIDLFPPAIRLENGAPSG